MKLNHYANATLVRILALVLNALGTLLLFPYILHSIGEHDFGIWSLTASITGYLLLVDLGISLACTRFLSLAVDDEHEWRSIISNAIALSAGLMLILILSGATLLGLDFFGFSLFGDKTLNTIVGILAIEAGISMVLRIYQSILRARVKYVELGIFEIIRVILRLLGLPLILFAGGNLYYLVLYSAAVNIAFFFLPWLYVKSHYGHTFYERSLFDRNKLKALFDFGKYAITVQLAELVRYRLDGIFIGIAMGITSIAHYAILITAVDMAVQILSRFLSYWEPLIIRYIGQHDEKNSLDMLFKSLLIGGWVSAVFIFNFYLFGELFLTLWVGEKYAYLRPDLTLLSSLMILVTFQMSITPYLNGHGLQKKDAAITLVEVTTKIVLAIPLIHLWGFKGLMLATLIPGLIMSLSVRFMLVAKVSGLPYSAILRRWLIQTTPVLTLTAFLLAVMLILQQDSGKTMLLTTLGCLQAVALLALILHFKKQHKLSTSHS